MATVFLVFIVSILVLEYILGLVSKKLTISNFNTELPKEFEGYYDNEKYSKSQEYTRDNLKFSLIENSFSTLLIITFILIGGFNYIDIYARSFGFDSIFTGLIFTGLLMLGSSIISLPFSVYSTFVIEEKYGFNKTTAKTFFLDLIKGIVLSVLIGGVVLYGILFFFESFPKFAWLYSWLGMIIFSITMFFLAPIIIMPLFNKFTPLEDGELKEKIDIYAKKQKFKMKGIYTMDGSKRSTKLNAYFTGFGKFRRIVFYDTLVEKISANEIVSVLAHEMGHFKLKHIFKGLINSILTMGLMFFILSLFINNQDLFTAFKMENISIYGSLIFFGFLYSPISMIISIFGNIKSRKHEYEADKYAVDTTEDRENMITALKKLSVENMSNLTPHPFNVFMYYSHPPVLERIRIIEKI